MVIGIEEVVVVVVVVVLVMTDWVVVTVLVQDTGNYHDNTPLSTRTHPSHTTVLITDCGGGRGKEKDGRVHCMFWEWAGVHKF